MQAGCVCVCVCTPVIRDEIGVIWLKRNNTAQIHHNPSHPPNWPVYCQSGGNFAVAPSDLFFLQIPGSQQVNRWRTSTTQTSLASAYSHTDTHDSVRRILRQKKTTTGPKRTRMGVCMHKVYCSSEVKRRCEVYLTWKVRGLPLADFATDIGSQEKWVVRKTRKRAGLGGGNSWGTRRRKHAEGRGRTPCRWEGNTEKDKIKGGGSRSMPMWTLKEASS